MAFIEGRRLFFPFCGSPLEGFNTGKRIKKGGFEKPHERVISDCEARIIVLSSSKVFMTSDAPINFKIHHSSYVMQTILFREPPEMFSCLLIGGRKSVFCSAFSFSPLPFDGFHFSWFYFVFKIAISKILPLQNLKKLFLKNWLRGEFLRRREQRKSKTGFFRRKHNLRERKLFWPIHQACN